MPAPAVKKFRSYNRLIKAIVMGLLMAAVFMKCNLSSFYLVYCKQGIDGENATASDDGISVTSRLAEINPLTLFTTDFTQPENNTTHSNENVPYLTAASSSPKLSPPQRVPRNMTFCSNHSNYTHTSYPNFAGDKSEHDFIVSWEFLKPVIDSQCHPRIEEFICLAAQPEYRPDGKSIGPCRKFCHEITNACASYFWDALEKQKIMLSCDRQYVDSTDQHLCHS
ncbi:uncharacterized protein LOC130695397 [Daphnia carinata]|uniref:uncharacterized protein LOC130695397 n=1 Tax=Daphnia carinata TaxID=120202 RepID=UPI0028693F78|nr:uncharacterized protein LOC130695397 [Daphnia carinata]